MELDEERFYRALTSRDARFDGWFVVGVTSTGIYCRASCPAPVRPRRENVRFFPTAATAQRAGFRACKRCRPDAAPGSPAWDQRGDLVGRAMRLIGEGVVDREGVAGLAARLHVSARHLHRLLHDELGAGPLALARANRAQTARVLIETTSLTFSEIAFAAGFASIRQFNDTIREVFAESPSRLRERGGRPDAGSAPGAIVLRLAFRRPFDAGWIFDFLARHAIAGVAAGTTDRVDRTLRLPGGPASVVLSTPPATADYVTCELSLAALRDLPLAVSRCRRLLDLDADPLSFGETLADDRTLTPLLDRWPGIRVPGSVDGFEAAVGAIVGQQVSLAGARTVMGRLATRFGDAAPDGRVVFPAAEALASADLAGLGLTDRRIEAIRRLATSVAAGHLVLDPGADRAEARARLVEIPGIGPWTADIVALRALGDPDVWLWHDLAVKRSLAANAGPMADRSRRERGDAWRPWRSYASVLFWADYLDQRDPRLPTAGTRREE